VTRLVQRTNNHPQLSHISPVDPAQSATKRNFELIEPIHTAVALTHTSPRSTKELTMRNGGSRWLVPAMVAAHKEVSAKISQRRDNMTGECKTNGK
jgi:hypothetical protein